MSNNNIDFFGISGKKKVRTSSPFSFLGNVGKNTFVQPKLKVVNFLGKPSPQFATSLVRNPQKKTTNVPQTYWFANPSHVPIWLQENDDRRLGKKKSATAAAIPKGAQIVYIKEKKSRAPKGEKKEKARQITEARIKAETGGGMFSFTSKGLLKARAEAEAKISRGKVPGKKVIERLARAQRMQLIRPIAPHRIATTQEQIEKQRLLRIGGQEISRQARASYKAAKPIVKKYYKEEVAPGIARVERVSKKVYKKQIAPRIEAVKEKAKGIYEEAKEDYTSGLKDVARGVAMVGADLGAVTRKGMKITEKEAKKLGKVTQAAAINVFGKKAVIGTEKAISKSAKKVGGLASEAYEATAEKAGEIAKGTKKFVKVASKKALKAEKEIKKAGEYVGERVEKGAKAFAGVAKEGAKVVGTGVSEAAKTGFDLYKSTWTTPATTFAEKMPISPGAVVARAEEVGKGAMKFAGSTYGKGERATTARVRRLVKGGLGAAFGADLTQAPRSRGRPRGPSGKYMIESKPVFEEEYQQWAAQQRALNRITPSIAQQVPVSGKVQQLEEQQAMNPEPQYPSEIEPSKTQTQMQTQPMMNETSTSSPMKPGEIDSTKQMQTQQRGPTMDDIKAAQELAQQQDNVLNAPNILKGELHATGGSLLTATGPQIMDAPNAFKGQLRTLNRGDPASMGEIKLSERPQTNPYGDEYIDIELGSGKPVLKKRPREKWMTGEAL